jgi:hypothetical protein
VTASPVTRRVFQSTVAVVEENTTFGMSRQRRANSISAGVTLGCWSAVGQWEQVSFRMAAASSWRVARTPPEEAAAAASASSACPLRRSLRTPRPQLSLRTARPRS